MSKGLTSEIAKFKEFGELMTQHGQDVILALIILVVGLIAAKFLGRILRLGLQRLSVNDTLVSMVTNIFYVLLLLLVVTAALHRLGIKNSVLFTVVGGATLVAVVLIILFRPYMPHLPYKMGNMIKAGDLLGRVEAIDFFHTRLKTFDGKTVFIPNHMILKEPITNYHFTDTRQIKLVVGISYRSDLLKAKKVLAEILAQEPRISDKPPARVYVLNLTENCVEITARAWVRNVDYWRTRCDLLEIIKLRLDQENIIIAFSQRDIHLYQGAPEISGEAMLENPIGKRYSVNL